MEIVYFHKKRISGGMSIEENFQPLIDEIGKTNSVKQYNVPYAGGNPINVIRNIIFIRKYSTKNGINHISGDIHYGVLGLIGRNPVLTIHDDYAYRQAKRGGWLNRFYKRMIWFAIPINIIKYPICTTPTTCKNVEKLSHSKKLRVITHQCIPPVFKDVPRPFNKEVPRLLQIGTDNNKNLETTLKVVSKLKCKLIVMKPMSDSQKDMAKQLGVDFENIFDVPFEEVVAEYQKCDIVLLPSLFEGLGMPIIEGQAMGKPVITSNLEAMNWTAGDGAHLLNNPLDADEYYNALIKIIKDDEYRQLLIIKGKENVKRFSLEQAVQSYTSIYQSLA